MATDHGHTLAVTAWWARVAGSAAPQQLEMFSAAYNALWVRARRTLGDATLLAIGDRALHEATVRHPVLRVFSVSVDGIRAQDTETPLAAGDIEAALCAALTRFLELQGHLTANILTPALHAELAAMKTGAGIEGAP